MVLIVFVALKIPHLFYPFYWDESWPYASGVKHMYEHGPSLMPGAIDGELSRGHPLMFHFLASCWMNVFGASNFVMHCFSLLIAILFLIAIYEAGLRMFDYMVAVTAIMLIAFQQIYFVQSSFVLLEMLLALLGFVSIYFYVTKKYLLTVVSLSMLYYTKESGMILGLVLGIDALIGLFNKQKTLKEKVCSLFVLGLPVLFISLFFIEQKRVSGWYVLPLYSNGIEQYWPGFYEKLRSGIKVLFRDDLRRYFYTVVIILSLLTAYLKKDVKFIFPAIAGLFVFFLCSDKYHWQVPDFILLPLFAVSLVFLVYLMSFMIPQYNKLQRKFTILSILFSISFLVYSALNSFFIDRYFLIALIPVLFLTAVLTATIVKTLNPKLFIPVLFVMLLIEIVAYKSNTGNADVKMGAFDAMNVQKDVISYLERNRYYNKKIASGPFMEKLHMVDPYTGFLSGNDTFSSVDWNITPATELIVFDNIEQDYRYGGVSHDTAIFRLIYRTERGLTWAEIYERK